MAIFSTYSPLYIPERRAPDIYDDLESIAGKLIAQGMDEDEALEQAARRCDEKASNDDPLAWD